MSAASSCQYYRPTEGALEDGQNDGQYKPKRPERKGKCDRENTFPNRASFRVISKLSGNPIILLDGFAMLRPL